MIVKLELIDGVIDLMVWQNKLEDVDKWLHSPIAKISGKINNRNGDASIWYDNGEIFSFDEEIIPKSILEEANHFYPIKETLHGILTELDDLRARVIEYESKISTPRDSTLSLIFCSLINRYFSLIFLRRSSTC